MKANFRLACLAGAIAFTVASSRAGETPIETLFRKIMKRQMMKAERRWLHLESVPHIRARSIGKWKRPKRLFLQKLTLKTAFDLLATKRVSCLGQYDRINDFISCNLYGDKRPVFG